MTKIEILNNKKVFQWLSVAGIIYINLLLVLIFLTYYQTKANFSNPLMPQQLIEVTFEPYALKGLLLSCGLMVLLILKLAKQNLLTVVASFLLLIIYHFTDHSIDIG